MTHLPSGTVTFLFTDIEGSTQLAQQYPEQWEALRARHHRILLRAMQAHHGHVFEIVGDAFCVAFATAIDASKAAGDAQRALHEEPWEPAPVRVRMGLLTGTAHLTGAGTYAGYVSLARAQRLMSAAHGGQVLVSLPTQQLVRDTLPEGVTLRDMGERRLKDLVLPECIYQLVIAGLPCDFPPIRTLDAYRHNLPAQLTSFIGRGEEMAQVKRLVDKHRLVTLTGPGGTGKTRLALQVAAELMDEYPDGVWLVELAALTAPDPLAETVLLALRVREQPGRTALDLLKEHLSEKKALIVLDNCEHLVHACARLVEELLMHTPGLRVLATSRERLGVTGEATWPLQPMSLPDVTRLPALERLHQYESVQLFQERAMLVQPAFAMDARNASAIAQICTRLDGIPLAIELAAARMQALTPDEISARLDDRFTLLSAGSRTGLPHHQTLRAAIDWSYNLLSPPEQDLLQRLSVFVGGWTLDAAQAMATRGEPSLASWLDLLTNLVAKSLVSHDPVKKRYSMLESVKLYALEALEASGRLEVRRSGHHSYFLGFAKRANHAFADGAEADQFDALLRNEYANVCNALTDFIQGGKADDAQRMVSVMGFYGGTSDGCGWRQVEEWARRALAMKEPASPAARAAALSQLCKTLWGGIDDLAAEAACQEALAIRRGLGKSLELLDSLMMAGVIASMLGKPDEARSFNEEGLALARQIPSGGIACTLLNNLGELELERGDIIAAERLYEQGLEAARDGGYRRNAAYLLQSLSGAAAARGDWPAARRRLEQALPVWLDDDDLNSLSETLSLLADVLNKEHHFHSSARLQGFVQSLCVRIGAPLQPVIRTPFQTTALQLKAALGEAAYQKAFEEGKSLTQEAAITIALRKEAPTSP